MKRIDNESFAVKNISRRNTFKYAMVLEGIIVGAICGVLIAGFRFMLERADSLRTKAVQWANLRTPTGAIDFAHLVIVALGLVVLAAIISLLLKWEPECAGSGIPQVEGEIKGWLDMRWLRVILTKMMGCVFAIGGGLALGREGPSVQLGAMVGKGFARSTHKLLTEERLLITCGAGAGLSAAFGAPLAGAIFALEELHKTFSALVLITTMASTAVSDWVASSLIGRRPVFDVGIEQVLPLKYYWAVILLGIILGVVGVIYNRTLNLMQDTFSGIGKLVPAKLATFAKLVAMFALSLLMIYVYPTALGSGGGLVAEICEGKYALAALLVMLIVKFVYSTGSFGSGSPGGIFLPLLVLGAICGGVVSRTLGTCFGISDSYLTSFVIIAMAGMFAAIVRAPATGIILITEMTGSFSCLLALVTVSLVAYITADVLGGEPVYEQLWNKRIGKTKPEVEEDEGNRKVVIEREVQMSSRSEGKTLAYLNLPKGCLIVAIIRDGKEIIPSGQTKLKAGDHMELLCRKKDLYEAECIIEEKCMRIGN